MGARVLLVEDNEHNLQLMTYLLTAQGHVVRAASRGDEAIALAKRERPDLVVMDIQLLGPVDGYEALRRLRANPELATVPVVAVTAFAMVGDRDQALAAGFTEHLTKPIDPRSFGASIDEHLPAELRGRAPAPPARHPTEVPGDRTSARAATRAKVLVVDDQPTNVALLRSILEPHGYRVVEASTVDEAVCAAQLDRPDVVLSDVHIRNELGFDLLRRLQATPELASIPFALTTATAELHEAGLPEARVEIISRPIEPDRLLAQVATLASRGRAS
jgi:two-component system cell cycle response regulator